MYKIKKLPLFLFLFLKLFLTSFSFAVPVSTFKLVINDSSKTLKTLFIGEAYYLKQYQASALTIDSANSVKGQFVFTGTIGYPTAFRVYSLDAEFNEIVFIEEGSQEVNLSILNAKIYISKWPETTVGLDYYKFLNTFSINNIDHKIPANYFFQYVRENPDSYVALFALIDQTFNYDFDPMYKEVANSFGINIRNTKAFKFFNSLYFDNKRMPFVLLRDDQNKKVKISFENFEGKFTLLEFWFNGCSGCPAAMAKIKEQYKSISGKIRVINVNVDAENAVLNSVKFIRSLIIPWENYWDNDGKQFENLTLLYKYPGNLLINEKGFIVAKDIDISKIKEFLPE